MNPRYFYAVPAAVFFLFASCSKNSEIRFDERYPLALAPDIEWAVVTDPYAAYKNAPDWNAEANGHCRKSDILQIEGTALSPEEEVWYRFKDGWLPSSAVAVYQNRFKAENAAGGGY
ncbi:MAG: hypothetical protein ACTTKL_04075 [Treponema sp.]